MKWEASVKPQRKISGRVRLQKRAFTLPDVDGATDRPIAALQRHMGAMR
ncbi:MAG: hypothetical protein RLN87_03230 [Parasphingopyxis sp.]|nr:hypothetical protein [uncultured Parasphingopyxis sp.]